MTTIHLDKVDGTLANVARAAFPSYTGRKFRLQANETIDVRSYWDGGSRDYFTFVRVADLKVGAVPAQSAFDQPLTGAEVAPIPPGFICVEHSIFCGKDAGLTFHVNPVDITPMLPVQIDLTWAERVVLKSTGYKSSYNGVSNYRETIAREESGISSGEYQTAKAALIARGLLNKAGAITTDGKNAAPYTSMWPKRLVSQERGT